MVCPHLIQKIAPKKIMTKGCTKMHTFVVLIYEGINGRPQ